MTLPQKKNACNVLTIKVLQDKKKSKKEVLTKLKEELTKFEESKKEELTKFEEQE